MSSREVKPRKIGKMDAEYLRRYGHRPHDACVCGREFLEHGAAKPHSHGDECRGFRDAEPAAKGPSAD